MTRWYLVHTKPAREALAQSHLERQGFRIYQPLLASPAHGGATASAHAPSSPVHRLLPLYPRYLFLRLDVGRQDLGPVRSTVGVSSIVRFGGQFAVVPDGVVSALKERADPVTGLHHLAVPDRLEPGSPLRVVAGAFDGLDGIFQRRAADERVVILLNLLGQQTTVQIPACFVASQAPSRRVPSSWSRHAQR